MHRDTGRVDTYMCLNFATATSSILYYTVYCIKKLTSAHTPEFLYSWCSTLNCFAMTDYITHLVIVKCIRFLIIETDMHSGVGWIELMAVEKVMITKLLYRDVYLLRIYYHTNCIW